MIRNSEGKLELVYLVEGDFCAKGTKDNLKVSDSGCGKLDGSEPNSVEVLEFNKTENSMITHKGSLENPKIENIKTNINNGKEAINQLLNITEL